MKLRRNGICTICAVAITIFRGWQFRIIARLARLQIEAAKNKRLSVSFRAVKPQPPPSGTQCARSSPVVPVVTKAGRQRRKFPASIFAVVNSRSLPRIPRRRRVPRYRTAQKRGHSLIDFAAELLDTLRRFGLTANNVWRAQRRAYHRIA